MKRPLVTDNTGLKPEGSTDVTFADDLVVDEATLGRGMRPNVHSFSMKQRDFSAMSDKKAFNQATVDAAEAQTKYGGPVEVRRRGHPLFGQKVVVTRVHLVYDGSDLSSEIKDALRKGARSQNVELHFHVP